MKILVIAAHPDDEVYGMGGTIAKLSEAGDEVHVLIVTDGCTAQYRNDPRLPQILAQKQEAVSYTHLDVYKRQPIQRGGKGGPPVLWSWWCRTCGW